MECWSRIPWFPFDFGLSLGPSSKSIRENLIKDGLANPVWCVDGHGENFYRESSHRKSRIQCGLRESKLWKSAVECLCHWQLRSVGILGRISRSIVPRSERIGWSQASFAVKAKFRRGPTAWNTNQIDLIVSWRSPSWGNIIIIQSKRFSCGLERLLLIPDWMVSEFIILLVRFSIKNAVRLIEGRIWMARFGWTVAVFVLFWKAKFDFF